MKPQNNSQRLPGICQGSPRCECAAFLLLGISGLLVIGSAVIDSARFAGAEDRIVDTLTMPYVIVQNPSDHPAGTNIAAKSSPSSDRKS